MKKPLLIIISTILLSIVWFYISGLETRYSYKSIAEKENIELVKNSDCRIQLYATPSDSSLIVNVVFDNLKRTILLDSVKVNILNNESLKLKEVTATDGFYNWEEEKNGKAETFDKLPEHLKIVNRDIRAYFDYSWSFDIADKPENIEIELLMMLIVENKRIQINKNIKMKLEKENVFLSPIRFH